MNTSIKLTYFTVALLIGFFLRIIINFYSTVIVDVDSFYIVGELVSSGKNVYEHTTRYNYGPVWSYISGFLYILTTLFNGNIQVFSLLLAIFLSTIDCLIAFVLYKHFSFRAGVFYILNPLSILLTSVHSQFDALAIFLALYAAIVFEKSKGSNRNKILALSLLSFSLITKHIYFLLPLWYFFKEKNLLWKYLVLILPPTFFLISFTPYLFTGLDGIISNVFKYRGEINTYFYQFFIPFPLQKYISAFPMFFSVLLLLGWFLRKTSYTVSFLVYSLSIVIFSPSLSTQYYTATLPIISIFPNIFFFLFIISFTFSYLSTLFNFVLYIPFINIPLSGSSIKAYPFIVFLFCGLIYLFINQKILFKRFHTKHSLLYISISLLIIGWIIAARLWENSIIYPLEALLKEKKIEQANTLFTVIHNNPPLPNTLFYLQLRPAWEEIEQYRHSNE